jgi:hypothetical protein
MQSHEEWLCDCHFLLIQCAARLVHIWRDEEIFERPPDNGHQNIIFEILDLIGELEFNDFESTLDHFALVVAANGQPLVDEQYSSCHHALWSLLQATAADIRRHIGANSDDSPAALNALRTSRSHLPTALSIMENRKGMLIRELADARNHANGTFQPALPHPTQIEIEQLSIDGVGTPSNADTNDDDAVKLDTLITKKNEYSTSELCQMFQLSNPTLRSYAERARIPPTGVGKSNRRYTIEDVRLICREIVAGPNTTDRQRAARVLIKIENKLRS